MLAAKIKELEDALAIQIQQESSAMTEVAASAQSAAEIQKLEMENSQLRSEVDKLAAKLSRAEAAARRANH